MSPTPKSASPGETSAGARSFASFIRLAEMSTPVTRAPRRAAAMENAPVPQPASKRLIWRIECGSHDRSVSRMLSRPARTVARMRLTGVSDVSCVHASSATRSK